MTVPTLRLDISTPSTTLVRADGVTAVRAEDESGAFGVLPGHADLMTVLPPSVVRWRNGAGETHYCALRGGVLIVTGGARVSVACRHGVVGDDLDALEDKVRAMRADELEAERVARVEQTRLHARAVRQILRFLKPGHAPGPLPPHGDAP